ncbi:MAG: AMP-binding protein [Acidimicrobiales bacterium]|nr:AMP-binding protein [Acidimicrobiales bacterium]
MTRELTDAELHEIHLAALAAVTGPGSPLEVVIEDVLGTPLPVFRHRQRSLREMLADAAERMPDVGYLTIDGVTTTRAELRSQVASVAAALRDRYGIGPGDRVGILAANCTEYAVTFWAVTALDAIVCAFNGWWTTEEIRYAAELTEPKLLLGDTRRLERVAGLDVGCPVVAFEDAWPDLVGHAPDEPLPDTPIAEDDPALILFTSGTTGRSKGALISHRGLVGFVQVNMASGAVRGRATAMQAEALGLEPILPAPLARNVTLLTSPMFHVSGLFGGVLMGLPLGMRLVLRRGRFDPEDVLRLIQEEGVTSWSPIGGTGPRVIHHPRFADYDVSSLRQVSFGGGPTSPAVRAEMQAAFPNVGTSLSNGYGSTETVCPSSGNFGMEYERHPLSAGRALTTVRIEIWDEDDRPVPDGVQGRVMSQSAYNFLGYWRNPEATAAALFRDRFLDTGDIGHLQHGMLFINSRARDMIIRSGENVYPIEVEARLDAHPSVRESAVVGSDHPEHGQEVKAIVVPQPGATIDTAALAAFCGETLAAYKVPTVWEVRDELLSRNASGKVLKTVLLGEAEVAPDDHREH